MSRLVKTLSAPFPPRDAKHAEDITMQPLGCAFVMIPICGTFTTGGEEAISTNERNVMKINNCAFLQSNVIVRCSHDHWKLLGWELFGDHLRGNSITPFDIPLEYRFR